MTLVEICVDDVGGAAVAAQAGADRTELCAALSEGGLTPTSGYVNSSVTAAPEVAHRVLIRPRAGDFTFRAEEVAVMCDDIETLRPSGVGFVVGATLPSGRLDGATLSRLMQCCRDSPVTCHKAFDGVPDFDEAIELLVDLGFASVLTSGGPGAAVDNLPMLTRIVQRAADRIEVVVGGGVRPANVLRIVESCGASAVHLRASPSTASAAAFGTKRTTDGEVVAQVVDTVRGR
jgi:copper homeostasis protein